MNPTLIISAVGVGCFVAGVVFSKAVFTETTAIKEHVTNEVAKLRGDVQNALTSAAKKV